MASDLKSADPGDSKKAIDDQLNANPNLKGKYDVTSDEHGQVKITKTDKGLEASSQGFVYDTSNQKNPLDADTSASWKNAATEFAKDVQANPDKATDNIKRSERMAKLGLRLNRLQPP